MGHGDAEMPREPYTPERAYRVSVRPLALFFIALGTIGAVVSLVAPEGAFIAFGFSGVSDWAKRCIFAAVVAAQAAIGVGLYLRRRVAWYAMFAYFGLGAVFPLWAAWTDPEGPFGPGPSLVFTGFVLVFQITVMIGLYFVTKPVFVTKNLPDEKPGAPAKR